MSPAEGIPSVGRVKKVIIILGALYELAEKNGALPCTRQPDGGQTQKKTPALSDFLTEVNNGTRAM